MARSKILDLQSSILDPRSSFLRGSYLCIRIRCQAEAFSFLLPYFLWKRSTRPAVSISLFAGEERVAVRADFHVNVFLRRTSRPRMTAGANDPAFDIFRMNSFFHSRFSFYLKKS